MERISSLKQVFGSKLSNDAKLVACYLIGIQDEAMPTVSAVGKRLQLKLQNTFFAFQELLNEGILVGTPESFSLNVEQSPLDGFTIAPINAVKAHLSHGKPPTSILTLIKRFHDLHERYIKVKSKKYAAQVAEMRELCKTFGVTNVEAGLQDFFANSMFVHYKRDYPFLTLRDFRTYLEKEYGSRSAHLRTHARAIAD